ncbi:MAG: hypothetical protein ACLUEV_09000 [Alistipes sp.]
MTTRFVTPSETGVPDNGTSTIPSSAAGSVASNALQLMPLVRSMLIVACCSSAAV